MVNLPSTMGTIQVRDDAALRRYLTRNRAPRLIVFYLSAWHLNYRAEASTGLLYEGEVALLRQGSWGEVKAFAGGHMQELALFPLRFWEQMAFAYGLERADFSRHAHDMAQRHGNLPGRNGQNLDDDCSIPAKLVAATRTSTAEELVKTYRTRQTQVLVYFSPLPACPGAGAVAGRDYGVVGAKPPQVWPVVRFRDDGSFAHLDPLAVADSTAELEQAVRTALP